MFTVRSYVRTKSRLLGTSWIANLCLGLPQTTSSTYIGIQDVFDMSKLENHKKDDTHALSVSHFTRRYCISQDRSVVKCA